jgi:hypothetical protein
LLLPVWSLKAAATGNPSLDKFVPENGVEITFNGRFRASND